ncbi:histone deacetylase family protein [Paracoccus xiamenensis]|uniref:histone deacetylase family protein n=1 Tax=Paracoccus xiamenensis TaxID=2714901 RepID=UPI00140C02AF|nr:histone deacetylase family protein [Paracoccus xiamenensis]NHF73560.1 histone deacetylase family protein [Paracoccus xiamenensis]
MTLLFTHEAAANHLTPPGHGEQQGRYAAVMAALADLPLDRREAPLARDADLLRCHPQSYLDFLRDAVPAEGLHQLDEDTFLSPGSLEAARRSAGGAVAAVDAVLDGAAANAFVAMRPPGHHALADRPMGFCLFGNAAIAAKHALDARGLDRVAVLDFDVHHGNGTQELLWDEPRTLFASSQQYPHWPGTGAADERGAHDNVINAPLPPESDGAFGRAAWDRILLRVAEFRPQLVILSAGFDAHADDPKGELRWQDEDYRLLTAAICDVARDCDAAVVSCLEGGYNLAALGRSVRAHVDALMRAA